MGYDMLVSPIKLMFNEDGKFRSEEEEIQYFNIIKGIEEKLGLSPLPWNENSKEKGVEEYSAGYGMLRTFLDRVPLKKFPTIASLPMENEAYVIPLDFKESFEAGGYPIISLVRLMIGLNRLHLVIQSRFNKTIEDIPRCDNTSGGLEALPQIKSSFGVDHGKARAIYAFGMLYRVAEEAHRKNLPVCLY